MEYFVKIVFAAVFLSFFSYGSEILRINSDGNFIVVSQESEKHFRVGDFISVFEGDEEKASGFVTIANSYGAIINLQSKTDEIYAGDIVALAKKSKPMEDFPKNAEPKEVEELVPFYQTLFQEECLDNAELEDPKLIHYNLTTGINFTNPVIQIEHRLDKKFSLGVQVALNRFTATNPGDLRGNLVGLLLNLNYYGKELYDGIWLRSAAGYYTGTTHYKTFSAKPEIYSAIVSVGYRFLKEHFNFGLCAGIQLFFINKSSALPYTLNVFSPVLAFDFGWAF